MNLQFLLPAVLGLINCLNLARLAVSSLTKFMEVWLADLMAACCLGTASLDLEALDHKEGP